MLETARAAGAKPDPFKFKFSDKRKEPSTQTALPIGGSASGMSSGIGLHHPTNGGTRYLHMDTPSPPSCVSQTPTNPLANLSTSYHLYSIPSTTSGSIATPHRTNHHLQPLPPSSQPHTGMPAAPRAAPIAPSPRNHRAQNPSAQQHQPHPPSMLPSLSSENLLGAGVGLDRSSSSNRSPIALNLTSLPQGPALRSRPGSRCSSVDSSDIESESVVSTRRNSDEKSDSGVSLSVESENGDHNDRLATFMRRQKRDGTLEGKRELKDGARRQRKERRNIGAGLGLQIALSPKTEEKTAEPEGQADGWSKSGKLCKVGQYVLDSQKFRRIDVENFSASQSGPLALESPRSVAASESASNVSVASLDSVESSVDEPSIQRRDLVCLGQLGQGNSGVVLLVEHAPTGDHYAVKRIAFDGGENDLGTLRHEIAAMDLIVHPNLVRTVSAFAKQTSVFVVQEYMDKGSLHDVLSAHKPLPLAIACHISHQILLGLSHLHSDRQSTQRHSVTSVDSRGSPAKPKFIHRDLKPANILANSKGEIKIADFGIMAVNSTVGRTTFVGTSLYMSPERIKGARYTDRSDIWAFGLTVCELVTGCTPFTAKKYSNFIELMLDITSMEAPALPEDMDPVAADFVRQCLRQLPEQRPSAQELLRHEWFESMRTTLSDVAKFFESIPSSQPKVGGYTGSVLGSSSCHSVRSLSGSMSSDFVSTIGDSRRSSVEERGR